MNGQETDQVLFAEEPVAEPIAGVMMVIDRLFNRLGTAPLQTLAMDVTFEPPRIKPGDDLHVVLEFRIVGKFPAEFRNPASSPSLGAVSLRANFWKQLKSKDGKLFSDYMTTLGLGRREFLLNDRKAVPSDQ